MIDPREPLTREQVAIIKGKNVHARQTRFIEELADSHELLRARLEKCNENSHNPQWCFLGMVEAVLSFHPRPQKGPHDLS